MNDTSKKVIIRHASELAYEFRRLTESAHLPACHWEGNWVIVEVDGVSHSFFPRYELKPGAALIENLAVESPEGRTLLVAVELSSRLVEVCRGRGLSVADLNGRLYLRGPGLLVDLISHRDHRFVHEVEPRNVFVGKSAALVRTLLTDLDRTWTQDEVQKRSDASSGLASRVFGYLVSQGFLEKLSAREYRLKDAQGLVDAWCRADKFADRASSVQYATFGSSTASVACKLVEWTRSREKISIAFTRWFAGWLRVPYTEPVVLSAYVSRLPTQEEARALGLSQVSDGGNVVLHVPNEIGVFRETQLAGELPLVSDAQIVVDLKNTGLRGPDQAKALRESPKFCRQAMRDHVVITLDESFRPEWYAPEFQPKTNFCVSALLFREKQRAGVQVVASKIRALLGGVHEIKATKISKAEWERASIDCLDLVRESGAKVFATFHTQESLVQYIARNERMGHELRSSDLDAARAEVTAWTHDDRKRELITHVYRNALQCLFHAAEDLYPGLPVVLEFDRVDPSTEQEIRGIIDTDHPFFQKSIGRRLLSPVVTFHDSKDNDGIQLADLMSGKVRQICYSNEAILKRLEVRSALPPNQVFHPRRLDASVAQLFSPLAPVMLQGMITLFLDDGVGRHLKLSENLELLQSD